MPDVMQYITSKQDLSKDPDGNLLSLDDWSPDRAAEIAGEHGILLTPEHLRIVQAVRDYYRDHGQCNQARKILKIMEASTDSANPRKHLYELFPGGPVQQACRIAGVPVPADCVDPSFGIAQ